MLGFFVFYSGCSSLRDLIEISGQTMGTTYTIKIISSHSNIGCNELKFGIDSVLENVNRQMSTWDSNSEISILNQNESILPILVSTEFYNIVEMAQSISVQTGGIFDITIYELMSLWGFGPAPKNGVPNLDDINQVLISIGYEKIILSQNHIQKTNSKIKLDLNAIAKGYGVDQVFKWINSQGYSELFVEIGGEVKCSGRNQYNKYWSIGIENPTGGNKHNQIFAAIIYSDGGAVATSGNYRNFVNINGEILGHTINPKTGYPIQTDVLSVTVLSDLCMVADAWATALMVMDYDTGLKMVNENHDIKAIWILNNKDGSRRLARSDGAKVEDSIYEIIP